MRAWWRLAVVGVCVVVAASCGDNLRPAQADAGTVLPPQDAPVADIASVRFATDVTSARAGQFATSFPLHQQRDVVILATVPVGAEPRLVRVEVRDPNGAVVETMRVAYAADPAPGATMPNPTNGPPLRVQKAAPSGTLGQIEVALAVMGTQLAEYGQEGGYTATVFVDDGAALCSGKFELTGDQP